MARKGLNCTLRYLYNSGSKVGAYNVRASAIAHSVSLIYTESQARVRSAFYPHHQALAPFAIKVLLNGEDEYVSFNKWMGAYAAMLLNRDTNYVGKMPPAMNVSIPSRNFHRNGIPMTGYEWGDEVGKMVWEQTLVFETVSDQVGLNTSYSSTNLGGLSDSQLQYFYPNGDQLSGDDVPSDKTPGVVIGDPVVDTGALDAPIRGGSGNPKLDNVDDQLGDY